MNKRVDQVVSGDKIVKHGQYYGLYWDRVHGVSEPGDDGMVTVTTDSEITRMAPDTVVEVV